MLQEENEMTVLVARKNWKFTIESQTMIRIALVLLIVFCRISETLFAQTGPEPEGPPQKLIPFELHEDKEMSENRLQDKLEGSVVHYWNSFIQL